MAVTSYRFFGTIVSETISGGNSTDWVNPGNAGADDTSYATLSVSTASSDVGAYLNFQNPGFTTGDVPSGAVIDGIEDEFAGFEGGSTDNIFNARYRSIKGGVINGTNVSGLDTTTEYGTTMTVFTVGGATNLMQNTWTDSDIRSSTFGGAHSHDLTGTTPDISMDYYKRRVYYTAAAGSVLAASGLGDASFTGNALKPAALSASGVAAPTFTGRANSASVMSAAGTSAPSFVGVASVPGVLSDAGAAAASFTGRATAASALSSSGTGALAATAESTASAALGASGAGVLAAIGAASAAGVLSVSGSGSASFAGSGAALADLAAQGLGAGSFASTLIAASPLDVSGVGSASFVGGAEASGVLSAAGIGAASLVSNAEETTSAVFSASGSGSASFAGAAITDGVFNADGSSVVIAYGDAIIPPEPTPSPSAATGGSNIVSFTPVINKKKLPDPHEFKKMQAESEEEFLILTMLAMVA